MLAPTRPISLVRQYTLNAGAVNEAIGLTRDLGVCTACAPGELESEFAGATLSTSWTRRTWWQSLVGKRPLLAELGHWVERDSKPSNKARQKMNLGQITIGGRPNFC